MMLRLIDRLEQVTYMVNEKTKLISLYGILLIISVWAKNAFSAEKTTTGCDVNAFVVSKLIMVNSETVFNGNPASICIEGYGGFRVRAGGKLILKNTTVTLLHNASNKTGAAFIKLDPGSALRLTRVKIISNLETATKEAVDKNTGALNIEGSENVIAGETARDLGVRLEISDSFVISKHAYSTGGIFIKPSTKNAKGVSGWIVNTRFENTWSPIKLYGAKNFNVSNNVFKRNPGTNISISGTDVLISKNEIVFPGNGYIGDGITIFNPLSESRILENNITGGSCYGIWFYNSRFRNILVSRNRISSGVTNGLNVSNNKKFKSHGLLIKENHFTANAGFGVGIDSDVSGVTLASNYFIGNASSFGDFDIAISNTAVAVVKDDNISAQKIDPNWAKERSPNRTHVNESIRVLRF